MAEAVRLGAWRANSTVAPSDHLAVAATLRFEPDRCAKAGEGEW